VVDGIVTTVTVDGIKIPGTITGDGGKLDTAGKAVYGIEIVGIVIVGTETTTVLGTEVGTPQVGIITTVVDGIVITGTDDGTNVAGMITGDVGKN